MDIYKALTIILTVVVWLGLVSSFIVAYKLLCVLFERNEFVNRVAERLFGLGGYDD